MASGVSSDLVSWFPGWHISGSNTARADYYNNGKNQASSPYANGGYHYYDELSLNVDRSFSPFNRVTAQASGLLYNDSAYRSISQGIVLERFNLKQENGEFRVPYRAEAGDIFAFQSYRTIQRSLKGVQLELQPELGWGMRHSISLFSGTASAAWDNFQWRDDWSNGASWLVEHPVFGLASANFAVNHKQANAFVQSALRQYVYSLAWEKRANWFAQQLTVEAEVGRFIGDHADLNGVGSGKFRQAYGYFTQVSGSPASLPALRYRLRHELYEQDYMPAGAAIQSDRRSEEGHLSWRFENGLALSSRVQNFHTARQTNNPTDTFTYGANVSGPLLTNWVDGMAGSLDGFVQNTESRDLTTNSITRSLNVSLSKSFGQNISVRAGGFYSIADNKNDFLTGRTHTRQGTLGLDMRFEALGFTGTVSPGLLVRSLNGRANMDINPTLNINAARGPHQLSMSYSILDQAHTLTNTGLVTRTAGLNYGYGFDQGRFGVEANWYECDPDQNANPRSDAYRVGAYLTYNFDRPARAIKAAAPAPLDEQAIEAATGRMAVDITKIRPGMKVDDAKALVADTGLGKPTSQAGLLLWYVHVLRELDQIQRLVLDTSAGSVSRTAVIIEFDDVGDTAGMNRTFERARRILLQQYGQPDAFFDQGDFGPNLVAELAAGRFVRVMEWKRGSGVLRFGIPRRLDGRIRMELQFGKSFPALKDTLWSLEQVL